MDKGLFVTETRQAVSEFARAMARLRELRRIYTSQDLGNNLDTGDFTGENEGLDATDVTNGMISIDSLDSLLADGHATNLDKLLRY